MGGSSASAGGAGRPGVTGHRQLQAALRKAHESLRRARPRVTSGARAPLEERIDEGSGGVPRRCSEEILFSRGTGADPQRGRRGRARSCHPHKLEKKPRRDMRGGDGLTPPPPSLRAARRGWRAGTSGGARAPPTSTGPAQIRPPPARAPEAPLRRGPSPAHRPSNRGRRPGAIECIATMSRNSMLSAVNNVRVDIPLSPLSSSVKISASCRRQAVRLATVGLAAAHCSEPVRQACQAAWPELLPQQQCCETVSPRPLSDTVRPVWRWC